MTDFRLLSEIVKKELIITDYLISYIIVRRNYLCRIGKVYISVRNFFIPVKRKTIQDSFYSLCPPILVPIIESPFGKSTKVPCPLRDLFFWCLLFRRTEMAKMLWADADDGMTFAIAASLLCR